MVEIFERWVEFCFVGMWNSDHTSLVSGDGRVEKVIELEFNIPFFLFPGITD